ncbi:TlpA disulfide reductase family protein [Sphingobacterium sp.]|uniref:TlpA family protein disulfide reductase n=1 Tax=Sphingobacterium sp. TaxID=341027 RepID=UPI0025865552|nr:TlpA disulfide reductase family protein [Sphingobacterium sp.]WET69715.1 MAG: TlpA disulfide reductase family protein [Sphingobacterium sp.]
MNTLQLLAFIRLFITYIFQVPVKYYVSTRFVQTKQMVRRLSTAVPSDFIEADSKSAQRNTVHHSKKGKSWFAVGRVTLSCIAVVSMFSLSAQTPRKDSGVDGLIKVEPLLIGQKLPEEFWKREYLVYNNGDTTRQTLEAYRGKLLVLDFWATWCAICLGQMKEKDELFNRFPADAKLIYVNPTQTKDTYTNIVKIQDRLAERSLSGKFQSIIEENYLQQLFPNYIYPRYVWIGPRGDLIGLTLALSVTDGHIKDMLNLINPKDGKK